MPDLSELNDDEVRGQATEWRARALRGDKSAGGIAHLLEKELHRRQGFGYRPADADVLDTRPLELLHERRSSHAWWRFW
ncbi:hypothetical protein D3C85_1830680 [compost metagenome]